MLELNDLSLLSAAINTGLVSTAQTPFGGARSSTPGREDSHDGRNKFVQMNYMCFCGIDKITQG